MTSLLGNALVCFFLRKCSVWSPCCGKQTLVLRPRELLHTVRTFVLNCGFVSLPERLPALSLAVNASRKCLEDLENKSLSEALQLVEEPGVYVDSSTYALLLQRCKKARALSDGIRVHNHIVSSDCNHSVYLQNLLLQMYCSCGALELATGLFSIGTEWEPLSWSCMIELHNYCGKGKESLQLFAQLLMEDVIPDRSIFATILSVCASMTDAAEGKRVHACVTGTIFKTDMIVSTSLVKMYSRCGSLEDASYTFDQISKPDTALWDVMITVYYLNGQAKKVLLLFVQMLCSRAVPSHNTLLHVVSASSQQADLIEARLAHALLVEHKLEPDDVILASLISMYGDFGHLEEAQTMFNMAANKRTVGLWNALIAVYSRNHWGVEALQKFNEMERFGVSPDQDTFVSIIGMCAQQTSLDLGEKIHGRLIALGLEPIAAVRVSLLKMYGSCGCLEKASKLFTKYPFRDTILWNALLAALAELNLRKIAIHLYDHIHKEGIIPDKATLIHILNSCTSPADLYTGRHIHACIMCQGCSMDGDIEVALVKMYACCGTAEDARTAFERSSKQSTTSWNTMLFLYNRRGQLNEVFCLFQGMIQAGTIPDMHTLVAILESCNSQTGIATGKHMHACIVAGSNFEVEVVGSALVTMYGNCFKQEKAQLVFDSIRRQKARTWFVLISILSKQGQARLAISHYDLMQQEGVLPDIATRIAILNAGTILADTARGKQMHVSLAATECLSDIDVCRALIKMYSECGCFEESRRLLDRMAKHDKASYMSILSSCSRQAAVTEGRRIHARIKGSPLQSDPDVGAALVNMYSNCGSLESAESVFRNIVSKNLDLWNAMLAACAQHSHGVGAVHLYDKMQEDKVKPDENTFSGLLWACSNGGLVDEAACYFATMQKSHSIDPKLDHYNSLMDGLGRAGMLDKAEQVLATMPFKADAMSWMGLLRACLGMVDVKRCEVIAEEAIKQGSGSVMPYVMLANTYKAAGMENDAYRVVSDSRLKGINKTRGVTSIEVMGRVHKFTVDDRTHPKMNQICAEVKRLHEEMEAEFPLLLDGEIPVHGVEEEHGLCHHSEELALAFGLLSTSSRVPLFLAKNLRLCPTCHRLLRFVSGVMDREINVREPFCFHKMKGGVCSCREYW